MLNRSIYVVQPYQVGTKHRKSLAIIIPSKIAKECNVNTSTVFSIRIDKRNNRIALRTENSIKNDKDRMMPAEERFQAPSQLLSPRT
jgi:antitoxin component of MazEF toxin-antitoxin module